MGGGVFLPAGQLITVWPMALSYGNSWPDDNVKAAFNWHWEFDGVGLRMVWNGMVVGMTSQPNEEMTMTPVLTTTPTSDPSLIQDVSCGATHSWRLLIGMSYIRTVRATTIWL